MKRAVLTVALLLLSFTLVVANDCTTTVTAPAGTFVGTTVKTRENKTVRAFLGLPYAKPPLGKLRFEAPQPIDPLNTTYNATVHASRCIQATGGSEDCLYLSLYTPKEVLPKLLPVFVFIHGGGLETGSADGFTHEYLLDEGIVVAVLQYRLESLGFLFTGDEVVPGNMGLKDQRCALRWIKENVRSFGGDPDKITIAGESAGAISVHYLMLFAANEGLFRAGISQSGSALMTTSFKPPGEVRRMLELLAELSLCPSDSYSFVECLRLFTAADLVLLYEECEKRLYPNLASYTAHVVLLIGAVLEPECVPDRLITANPWERNTTLPWLAGVNSKELLMLLRPEILDPTGALFDQFDAGFDTYYPQIFNYQSSSANGSLLPRAVRQFYLNDSPISWKTATFTVDALSDPFFTYPLYESLKRANRSQTYIYVFDYIGCNQASPIQNDARYGLFRAGISQSGCALVPWGFKPPGEVRRMVELLAELSLCPSDSYGLVECLRLFTAADLATLYTVKYKNAMYPGMEAITFQMLPLVGGVLESECVTDRLITANPWERITTLPWLVGVNSKEGLSPLIDEVLDPTDVLFEVFDDAFDTYYPQAFNYQSSSANGSVVPGAVRQFYLNNSPFSRKTLNFTVDTLSDPMFNYPLYASMERVNQSQTYVYIFDYIGCNQLLPFPNGARVGASHADELYFFFPTQLEPIGMCNATEDTQLSKRMVKLWIQFATHLDPTPLSDESGIGVTWKPFNFNQTFLFIDQKQFNLNCSFLPNRMKFWENQPFPFRDDSYEEQPCTTNYTGTETTLKEKN